jgi:small subunit ribosomal protein S33
MASTQNLMELSRKIFQRLPQKQIRSGNKVINKQLKGEKVASWFTKPILLRFGSDDPNFEIINQERLAKLDQMKRRGKSIPKKGAGKRSKK